MEELLHRKEESVIHEVYESDEDELINLIPQDTTMKTNLAIEDKKKFEPETVTVNKPVKFVPKQVAEAVAWKSNINELIREDLEKLKMKPMEIGGKKVKAKLAYMEAREIARNFIGKNPGLGVSIKDYREVFLSELEKENQHLKAMKEAIFKHLESTSINSVQHVQLSFNEFCAKNPKMQVTYDFFETQLTAFHSLPINTNRIARKQSQEELEKSLCLKRNKQTLSTMVLQDMEINKNSRQDLKKIAQNFINKKALNGIVSIADYIEIYTKLKKEKTAVNATAGNLEKIQ